MGERKSLWKRLPNLFDGAEVLDTLKAQNDATSRALAADLDTAPEALYYLATDGSPATRRLVAANPSAPPQANRLLADDKDDDVRVELARKVGRLLPDLSANATEWMRDLTIETLERLARDTLPRVRQALAEEIKALDCVPRRVIKALARDIESVAAPVLEYSPLLSDNDLVEIISSAQASFALLAIAKRKPLRPSVAEAIATALDVPAVAELLLNSSAEIRHQTLDKIVQHAERIREWHLPLVLRNDLSQRAIKRLAAFVSKSLIETLATKHNLDEKTRLYLKEQMKKRIDSGDILSEPAPPKPVDLTVLKRSGKLDDAFVEKAVEAGSRETVIASLALLSGIAPEVAARIFQTNSPKPIVSLVWRSGLSMRVAFKIQTLMLRLPGSETLPAREGVRFPLTEKEMRWHLNYFGVPA